MPEVKDLREQKLQIVTRAREINDQAIAEGRAFTAEEQKAWDQTNADIDRLDQAIERDLRLKKLEDALGRSTRDISSFRPDPGGEAAPSEARADLRRKQAEHKTLTGRPGRTHFTSIAQGQYGERTWTDAYREEFRQFIRSGTIGPELRALQADADAAGGFTIAPQVFVNELIQAVHDMLWIAGLATPHTLDRAESLGAPVLQTQFANATWGTELSAGSLDSTGSFGKRELRPHPLSAEIYVSKKLLRQSGIDVEALVRDQFQYHFGIPYEQALIQGNGQNKPLGFYSTDAANPITTGRDQTASSSGAIQIADDLIKTKYGLKVQYWPRSSWMVTRDHMSEIRQLKDNNGQYLWAPAGFSNALVNGDQPDQLLNRPMYMTEYAQGTTQNGSTSQTLAVNGSTAALHGYLAILGDFSRIWTATALDMQIQHLVELKAEQNQDAFIGRLETDGMPVLGEAFSRLRAKGY